ncbi:sulfatase-like hydrolase/transferase [Rhodopirellula sp. JC639]|uniref:sulfatase-like hydrolase/transferase n=1 Tax=Stieleria mannarensis TaxID=2755585 RepID=UPI0016015297|nr:sulfatase-like hydrolase/transferase [Rhodopirellula sp. JC639]
MKLIVNAVGILCLIGFLNSGTARTALAREIGDKPNVILIMADDVSWEAFSCYGAEDYSTPHIDALAADGVRFTHCYSTPICTPSRVKLMTGKYNFRNYTHFGYLDPKEKTFGHLMQAAGYKTAIAGKWQLNGLYNQLPGHDDSTRPQQAGFDESYLWQVTTGKQIKEGGGERFWSPPLERNGRMQTVQDNRGKYGPDLLCDFICDFMQRNQHDPFFVYYPMMLVHDPFVQTPDTIGDAPRDQSANKAPKNKAQRKENFVAMVHYMDKIVGRIVAKVRQLDQLENTIVIFTADNGTNTSISSRWNGQMIRGGKGGMTDMGTHVPMVASWKGTTPPGTVLDDLIEFTDLFPTLAAASGQTLGADDPIDGRSFLPQLRGETGNPRQWVLCHYQPYWNKTPGQFVRNQEFKLYRDGRFYNVPVDLRESNDLADQGLDSQAMQTRQRLTEVIERCPPAPTGPGKRDTEIRPVYPDWINLIDPND